MSYQAKSNESSNCNKTAYLEWYYSKQFTDHHQLNLLNQFRTDLLQVDRSQKDAWRIMNFDTDHDNFLTLYGGRRPESLNITMGQAMELSSAWCRENIHNIERTNSGSHGPPSSGLTLSVDNQGAFLLVVHDAMCSSYCLVSDILRADALAESKCDCVDLSTKSDDIAFTKEGDFCRKSSGKLLCNQIDHYSHVCGQCELRDFACARREYNSLQVPLRGYGNECSVGTRLISSAWLFVAAYAINLFLR